MGNKIKKHIAAIMKKRAKPLYNVVRRHMIRTMSRKAAIRYSAILKNKKGSEKKKFAAYVVFDSTFGMHKVLELMENQKDRWDYKLVIIPDISRGAKHAEETYEKTKIFFVERYGSEKVIDGWNVETNQFYDHTSDFDIIYFANPYDGMVHKFHSIRYASQQNVLPVYVSYGYDVGKYTTLERLENYELNLVWKCFVDTTFTYKDYQQYQVMRGENVVLSGYSKMDGLKKSKISLGESKKILISSHHTVSMNTLPLSNFLKYYNFFLSLPTIFPDAVFIFRPHPLLFTTLINEKIWSEADVEKYLEDLTEKNIVFSKDGSYFDLFEECDAIINDCGSFTIEWLYTGKPGCFMYNEKLGPDYLTPLMNRAIEEYSVARSEKDIVNFVANVVNGESQQYDMKEWVSENIALRYPNVSQYILDEIDF